MNGRKLVYSSLVTLGITGNIPTAQPSIVSNEIPYGTFRDFAENKGVCQPGTTNLPIYDKSGNLVGRLDQAPMIDFSSADTSAIATLIHSQYIVSVRHNDGYSGVRFGDGQNRYNIVDRNNHPVRDFHTPRLDKLVTEVVPAAVTAEGTRINAYKNTQRYTAFYRVGSGIQYVKNRDKSTIRKGGAYQFRTGGTVGSSAISDWSFVNNPGLTFDPVNDPLASYSSAGDSGSPLFAWDTSLQKWALVAVLTAGETNDGNARTNWFVIVPVDDVRRFISEDFVSVDYTPQSGPLLWNPDSENRTERLTRSDGTAITVQGKTNNDPNAARSLVFNDNNGQIILQNNVDQGAGSLTFNDDYTVSGNNNTTWMGAGVNTATGADVIWQVNGVSGDNLYKVGPGTLRVNASGRNPGG